VSDVIGKDHPSAQTTTNQYFVGSEEIGTTFADLFVNLSCITTLDVFCPISLL
jgi:hypothetical protein